MKQTTLLTILAAGVFCAATPGTALAQQRMQQIPQQQPSSFQQMPQRQPQQGQQQTTSSTSTAAMATTTGTFAQDTPSSDHFMFRPSTNGALVRYYQTKDTVIVDAEGHAVDQSTIRVGVGATMYYTTSGDRMIARKIVIGEGARTSQKKAGTTETKRRP